jgi:hypothetical protein
MEHALSLGTEVVETYPVEPELDDAGCWQNARSYRAMG